MLEPCHITCQCISRCLIGLPHEIAEMHLEAGENRRQRHDTLHTQCSVNAFCCMLEMRLFSDSLQVWRISIAKKWIAGSVSSRVPAANVSLRPRSLAANTRPRGIVRRGRSWLTSVLACKSWRENFVGGRDVLHLQLI